MANQPPLTLTDLTHAPKVDPKTGELVFFGYSFDRAPYFHAGVMDPEGRVTRSWEVDVAYPTMSHDMAVTANYLALLHLPLVLDPGSMMKGADNSPLKCVIHPSGAVYASKGESGHF